MTVRNYIALYFNATLFAARAASTGPYLMLWGCVRLGRAHTLGEMAFPAFQVAIVVYTDHWLGPLTGRWKLEEPLLGHNSPSIGRNVCAPAEKCILDHWSPQGVTLENGVDWIGSNQKPSFIKVALQIVTPDLVPDRIQFQCIPGAARAGCFCFHDSGSSQVVALKLAVKDTQTHTYARIQVTERGHPDTWSGIYWPDSGATQQRDNSGSAWLMCGHL